MNYRSRWPPRQHSETLQHARHVTPRWESNDIQQSMRHAVTESCNPLHAHSHGMRECVKRWTALDHSNEWPFNSCHRRQLYWDIKNNSTVHAFCGMGTMVKSMSPCMSAAEPGPKLGIGCHRHHSCGNYMPRVSVTDSLRWMRAHL